MKEEDVSDAPMADTYAVIEEFQPFEDEDIKQAVAALSNVNYLVSVMNISPELTHNILL